MNAIMFETMVKHWIKKIKDAGFNDPTKEVIKYNHGDKTIVIKLFTEEQWHTDQNEAQIVAKNFGFNKKPDHVVTVDDVVYYVEILSN